jgi:hypothetical protein
MRKLRNTLKYANVVATLGFPYAKVTGKGARGFCSVRGLSGPTSV